ncbi:MAG: hypothetical protein PHU97_02560 [Bacteroidales bacterium]|nr:hypothetical protein [Bacteroidales bacterium]MDD2322109.1 hypothetical protein [Bacteroidales bacterium]MDD3010183.1 hypothetical protein [Bacteroidales bacterium]MDD3961168.1 hypothetical protein [Bacteroidales bacterium]MDY0286145.1 hypothetical protein [Bacteroidales bacterium]
MDKTYLLQTAADLFPVSPSAADEYKQQMDKMIHHVNEAFALRPDTKTLIGPSNEQMMKDNHQNHARFMYSLFIHYDPEVFVSTVLWVFKSYCHHGFSSLYWAAQLNAWVDALKMELSDAAYREILPYYFWMQVNIPIFTSLSSGE